MGIECTAVYGMYGMYGQCEWSVRQCGTNDMDTAVYDMDTTMYGQETRVAVVLRQKIRQNILNLPPLLYIIIIMTSAVPPRLQA